MKRKDGWRVEDNRTSSSLFISCLLLSSLSPTVWHPIDDHLGPARHTIGADFD
jgi:hypothetical protein